MKKLSEQAISSLEKQIPELAEGAVRQAYSRTLASGRNVVEAINGKLVRTKPDGTKKEIKSLHKSLPVTPGQKLTRKR